MKKTKRLFCSAASISGILVLFLLLIPHPIIHSQPAPASESSSQIPLFEPGIPDEILEDIDSKKITPNHAPKMLIEANLSETQLPFCERHQQSPVVSLKPLRAYVKSILSLVRQEKLPHNSEFSRFENELTIMKEQQRLYLVDLRRIGSKGRSSALAHNRINEFELIFNSNIDKLLDKISILAHEIDSCISSPHHFPPHYKSWESELELILEIIGKTKNEPRIMGTDQANLPFGETDAAQKPITLSDGFPDGYENPPTGYTTGSQTEGSTESTSWSYFEESPWNVSSTEIIDLVHQLGDNPVNCYEYVLNNCETEFYYGVMKGARATLSQKSGNDNDQVSLLMAMYRVLNIPTRYIQGVIEIPLDMALNWTGLDNGLAVERLFNQAGIPYETIFEETQIESFHIEHFWMEAYIPYDSYRGVIEEQTGFQWIPLDPSVKLYTWQTGQDILNQMSFNAGSILNEYTSTHRPSMPPFMYVKSAVEEYLDTQGGPDYESILHSGTIQPENLGILPYSTPFKIICAEESILCINNYYAILPDDMVARARLKATRLGQTLIDETFYLCELLDGKLTLSYVPASSADQNIADSFFGLYNTPPWMVEVRGVLRRDNDVKTAFSQPIDMAVPYDLTWEMTTPSGSRQCTDTMLSGNFCAIGLGTPAVHYTQDDPTVYQADSLYYGRVAAYLDHLQASESELACLLRVNPVYSFPSHVTVGGVLEIDYAFDIPIDLSWEGMFLDVNLRSIQTVAIDNNQMNENEFLTIAGAESSFLEGYVFFDGFGIESISTLDCIGLAHDESIDVLDIDETNAGSQIPLLSHPQYIIDAVVFAVNQGYTVRIPVDQISYLAWTGSGYIVHDPLTGKQGFYLSGDIAGGMTALSPELMDDRLQNAGNDPSASGDPVTDPSKATKIIKLPSTDFQMGTVNAVLDKAMKVLVTDSKGHPVKTSRSFSRQ